jgi:hypothetical protein
MRAALTFIPLIAALPVLPPRTNSLWHRASPTVVLVQYPSGKLPRPPVQGWKPPEDLEGVNPDLLEAPATPNAPVLLPKTNLLAGGNCPMR